MTTWPWRTPSSAVAPRSTPHDLGITPLWIAATNSSAAMINRLLEAGADPNIVPPPTARP